MCVFICCIIWIQSLIFQSISRYMLELADFKQPISTPAESHQPRNILNRSTPQDRDSLVYHTGTMKLADFGLSKSLPMNKHAGFDLESKFKLTGETGSYRYMAPEVFRHEPYNKQVGGAFVADGRLLSAAQHGTAESAPAGSDPPPSSHG